MNTNSVLSSTVIVLALAGSIAFNLFLWSKIREEKQPTEVIITQTTDTVTHIKEYHTRVIQPPAPVTIERLDTLYIRDTLRIEPEEIQARRVYEDSIVEQGVVINYRHHILGLLESSEYKVKVPEVTIMQHKESATFKQPRYSLYPWVGAEFALDRADLRAGALITYDQYALGYSYGMLTRGHALHFGVRMWQR